MTEHRGELSAEILTGDAARNALAGFDPAALTGAGQHPLWIDAWIAEAGRDSRLVLLRHRGRPIFALPLDISRRGSLRVAEYMSGSHANGNFPLMAHPLPVPAERCARMALAALGAPPHRSDRIDLLVLRRQLDELAGVPNPMLSARSVRSPDPAPAISLHGGFEAILARGSAARKRKKRRWQLRKFEAHGQVRYLQAGSPAEVVLFLERYFAMKEARFAGLGIRDPFAGAEVRRFLHRLYRGALDRSGHAFVLHGLEVGGELRAVAATSTAGGRITCEFTGFAQDTLAHASPGDFLFYEMIGAACSAGMDLFDFSTGDEPYKRQWSDLELPRFDSHHAFTLRGAALSVALRAATEARRLVKSNPVLVQAVRRCRRQLSRGNAKRSDD